MKRSPWSGPGQRVYIHNGCAEPVELVKALTRRGPELRDVEVIHMATMGIADYSLPEHEGHFRANALFIAANVRQAVQEGRADYTPIFLAEIEGLFRSGALPIDVALLQCTPPDHYGYMSFGPSVDVTVTVAQCARHLIVEINDQMPRALGDAFLHVSRVNAFIETSHPLVEYPSHEVTDLHRAIARNIAALIPDGATIQTGIGGIPEATLALLGNHKDLGVHSEMVPDGVIELIQAGVINGERKTLHPHKVIAGFRAGHQAAVRFHRQQPHLRVPPHRLLQRPVRDRPERPHGGHQLGHRSGPHRPGLLGLHGPRSLQRHRRAGGFSARRRPLQGRRCRLSPCPPPPETAPSRASFPSSSPAPAWSPRAATCTTSSPSTASPICTARPCASASKRSSA